MLEPLNHKNFTKAICDVAGVLFSILNHEPQPSDRRSVLERIRAAIDEVLAEPEPEEPPEMPRRTVDFYVQSSNGENEWIHHPTRFGSEIEARHWAREDYCKWNRIQRVETSYTLVERPEER